MSEAKKSDGLNVIVKSVLPLTTDLVNFALSVWGALLLAGLKLYFALMLVPGIHTQAHAVERLAREVPVTS
jgi:hypothetical protein